MRNLTYDDIKCNKKTELRPSFEKGILRKKKHKEFDPPLILPAFLGLCFSFIN